MICLFVKIIALILLIEHEKKQENIIQEEGHKIIKLSSMISKYVDESLIIVEMNESELTINEVNQQDDQLSLFTFKLVKQKPWWTMNHYLITNNSLFLLFIKC